MPERMLRRPPPILVTGVPRSGTTWLARWLARGGGMALTGREPMNPRGNQYGLAGTIDGWVRITQPRQRQVRALRRTYSGVSPWAYSRYGTRRWAAALPWTRLVVKDPFALLSIPFVAHHTGAQPVLIFRHPGAVLVSYRRMGWQPDLAELRAVVEELSQNSAMELPSLPPRLDAGTAEAMGYFWACLHEIALTDAVATGTDLLVVAHHELATAQVPEARRFAGRLSVRWTSAMEGELHRGAAEPGSRGQSCMTSTVRPPRSPKHGARDSMGTSSARSRTSLSRRAAASKSFAFRSTSEPRRRRARASAPPCRSARSARGEGAQTVRRSDAQPGSAARAQSSATS